jgi:twitching motility protein PilT
MMQAGQSKYGMQTMNQSLFELYRKGALNSETALSKSTIPEELLDMMQKAASGKAR